MSQVSFTFNIVCSFVVQQTFVGSEIEPDPDGTPGAVRPREEALEAFAREVELHLQSNYPVHEVFAQSSLFLGKVTEGET